MEDEAGKEHVTGGLLLFLLSLSALGGLWTLSCSWMATRKKRLRVGNEDHGVSLEVPRLVNSPRERSPASDAYDRQFIVLPIGDFGQSLNVPLILVTPPSPVGLVQRSSSSHSISSIGSADDLLEKINMNDDEDDEDDNGFELKNDDDGEINEADNEGVKKGQNKRQTNRMDHRTITPPVERVSDPHHIRESMRNKFFKAGSTSSKEDVDSRHNNSTFNKISQHGQHRAISESPSRAEVPRKYCLKNTSSFNSQTSGVSSDAVITINGDDDSDDEDFFNLDTVSPRPRLPSLEPGTAKTEFEFSKHL